MEASIFWNIIAQYNTQTIYVQIALFVLLAISVAVSYKKRKGWACKMMLSFLNLFIGIAFFIQFGTEPIQNYFALPLYILVGVLFAYETIKTRDDALNKPTPVQLFLAGLYLAYPLVSMACGNEFPRMVTHIMPCPVATISIVLYSLYNKKNPILMGLLAVWGLTGVKAIPFKAYEDLILLAAGIYGVYHTYLILRKNRKCS